MKLINSKNNKSLIFPNAQSPCAIILINPKDPCIYLLMGFNNYLGPLVNVEGVTSRENFIFDTRKSTTFLFGT